MKASITTISKREIPIPPVSRSDVAFNAIALVLNSSLTLWGMTWLILHWTEVDLPWYVLIGTIFLGLFLSDFFSGLLHWAFDTWFTENTPLLERMVLIVREHHVYPQHIFRYQFHDEAGSVSWPSLAHTIPAIGLVTLRPSSVSVVGYCTVILSVMVSVFTLFMLQFHKLGHRKSDSSIVRSLQRIHLLMSPQHHGQHHRGNHDIKYCLINGWADFVMDSIGFWRGMEWIIHWLTKAVPRSNDKIWLKRDRKRSS
jgi:Lipid desaturase domain